MKSTGTRGVVQDQNEGKTSEKPRPEQVLKIRIMEFRSSIPQARVISLHTGLDDVCLEIALCRLEPDIEPGRKGEMRK